MLSISLIQSIIVQKQQSEKLLSHQKVL